MTNFAVLVDWSKGGYPSIQKKVLSFLSIIGLSISSAALAVALVTILASKYFTDFLINVSLTSKIYYFSFNYINSKTYNIKFLKTELKICPNTAILL